MKVQKGSIEVQGLTHDNYTGGFEATMLTDKEDLRRIRKQVYATLTTTQREYQYSENQGCAKEKK